MLIVVDVEVIFLFIGVGDVFEFEDGVIVVGFGGNFVLFVVCVLMDYEDDLEVIVCKVMEIVVWICVYINDNLIIEIIEVG